MQKDQEILSDITVFMKYAKYRKDLKRREIWEEIVDRNKLMHIKKFPKLRDEIEYAYKFVYEKKVLPSMRSLQFAGKPIEISPNRVYNCAFLPIDHWKSFGEIMFLLLGGTGVGFSVQKAHIEKLPEITIPTKKRRFLISDNIEGWALAVDALIKSYFFAKPRPDFDFSDIRAKGEPLITSGGKAPGPEPLRMCLQNIERVLLRKQNGDKLTTLEVHDIVCFIADAVLAGGIRRAALISLFDIDDEEMLTCKFGNWWELNPQRGRANNSAVVVRHKVKKKDFLNLWKKVEASNSGEPGIYFTNNPEWGTNPCCEIALRPYQFCNLTELNGSTVESQEDLNERAKVATFIGTLQASYTDFHYLRDIWKRTTEKDALVGVGITGIASNKLKDLNLEEAARVAKEENERVASIIGINSAKRINTIKPSGTSSLVLGCSSGIHAWHNDYYLRRIRVGKNESIYTYLKIYHPELLEDDVFRPETQAIITVPQKAPSGAITRTEDVMELLDRIKRFNIEWVKEGHVGGDNTNNVSATVSIKPNEWEKVGEWMWTNKETFNGLSVLPFDNGSYVQAPFEDITEEEYNKRIDTLHSIDLRGVVELDDTTDQKGEVACSGNSCEII